ncbi:hypothetical protein BDP81DRAFT_462930 [Colletotrichum phormii]|uniref:SnoaL-like domain-containing protein n=1 Tax=Colletotrichum phormii TaxID=359342 RepID=A0AAJ0EEY5_9PEZI|nr:uncharacterized protein BDP81DRAFT_462930 [Colletotrichum phormii]KAK1634556.1 hypothetical protein BDP81DRAFT_462930 [Colletotrichum phormii]
MPVSKYHKEELVKEEQEVMDQLYRGLLHYWNKESRKDYHNGMVGTRRFYDFDDMLSYDMFGNTIRGSFKEHFDSVFLYWNNGNMEFKDIEITALSKEYAYSTMIQHTWGTAGNVPKNEGQWKWIHEHLSFPTDMATKAADFTSTLDPLKATKMK